MAGFDRPREREPPIVLSAGLPEEDEDVTSGQLLEIEAAPLV